MRVLVVADSRMTRLLVRQAVEMLGHEIVEASDGDEAWWIISRTNVDVVVSDWRMPGLEGPELCRRVRARRDARYTNFILMTTLEDRRYAMEAMEAGADDYLPKPVDAYELHLRLIGAKRITELHKELAERDSHLRYLAEVDPLPGLPNRNYFLNRLEQALDRATLTTGSVGVIFLDLDNFKVVNDSLWHQEGDSLLVEVARRLRTCVRASDSVSRLGGDEFTMVIDQLSDEQEALMLAERVSTALQEPLRLSGREVFVTASVGVAGGRPGEHTPESLLRNADLAMYLAKVQGKARPAVFNQTLEATARLRLELA